MGIYVSRASNDDVIRHVTLLREEMMYVFGRVLNEQKHTIERLQHEVEELKTINKDISTKYTRLSDEFGSVLSGSYSLTDTE